MRQAVFQPGDDAFYPCIYVFEECMVPRPATHKFRAVACIVSWRGVHEIVQMFV